VSSPPKASPRRGRPRDERADVAIAASLRELLEEVGYFAVTMEAVAARAGVSKATLYRRHGSKAELVFATVVHARTLQTPDTGTLRGDLTLLGQRIVTDLASPPVGAALPGLLADLAQHPPLRAHFHDIFIGAERTVIAELLDRARCRGELAEAADADLVHALLLGSIFASLFLLDLSPGDALGERLAALTATALERPRP